MREELKKDSEKEAERFAEEYVEGIAEDDLEEEYNKALNRQMCANEVMYDILPDEEIEKLHNNESLDQDFLENAMPIIEQLAKFECDKEMGIGAGAVSSHRVTISVGLLEEYGETHGKKFKLERFK